MALAALLLLSAIPLQAAQQVPTTEEQKTLYTVGLIVAKQLVTFNFTPEELAWVQAGITDAITTVKPVVDIAHYNDNVQELYKTRRKIQGDKQSIGSKEFLEKAASVKGAVKSDSGVVYLSLKEGSGAVPKAKDMVKVHYRGTLMDGREFDSSYKRNKPLDFRLDGVINCWTEGLQKMKVGGKAKLVCPPDTAYGDNGAGDLIPPGATLAFEVELLEVVK
jgi:FKBP-type peptidyl-prolyl cis-trans isomerase FkpA